MVGACQPRYNQPLRRNPPTDKASGRCSLPTSRRYFGSTPPKQWMAQRRGTHEMAQFAVNVMCPSERGPPTVTGLFSSSATKRPATQNYDNTKIAVARILGGEERQRTLSSLLWLGPL